MTDLTGRTEGVDERAAVKVDFKPLTPTLDSTPANPGDTTTDVTTLAAPGSDVAGDRGGVGKHSADEPSRRRGGLFRRAPKPEKAPKAPKAPKPKSAAQIKRENDQRKRAMRLGVRYGGDRWKWFALQVGVIGLAALSVIALVVAMGKPSKSSIQEEVQTALDKSGQNFPSGQAVMWANAALRTWGTWDEAMPDSRKVALAPFLSSGMDAQGGWNGKGTQTVIWAAANPQPRVTDANHASVDFMYQIQDGSWRCVAMPLYAYKPTDFTSNAQWAFALAANPVPTACTPRTGAPSLGKDDPGNLSAGNKRADAQVGQQLSSQFFPGFFAAYASSDSSALTQYTASGVTVVGLGGAMSSIPQPIIQDAVVYVDSTGVTKGKVYTAVVPVTWTLTGTATQISATYLVPIKQDGDRWYVAGEPQPAIQAAEAQGGAPAQVPEPGDGVEPGSYSSPSVVPTSPSATLNPNTSPTPGAGDPPPTTEAAPPANTSPTPIQATSPTITQPSSSPGPTR